MNDIALKTIDQRREELIRLSDYLWENPEPAYTEFKAVAAIKKVLVEDGFVLEDEFAGMPTAFIASWGSGNPVIGFLAEYDALPGLSQKISVKQEPVIEGAPGQGCGHNLLGVATLGAVLGLKQEMIENNLPGTVVFYGCPAEEVLTGKVFMARDGAFDRLDLALAYHPGRANGVSLDSSNGLNSAIFHFEGRTAHAGGDPHNGRSALDAVELMNVGANYLREHVTTDVRIHYVIKEGGKAPNIVPDKASVWYYVRGPKRSVIDEVYARLIKVANGAAMMTETTMKIEFLGGCHNTLPNKTLATVLHESLSSIPQEPWTEEEIAFSKELNQQQPVQYPAALKMMNLPEGTEIFTGVSPMRETGKVGGGSTDVGDVAHIVPTASFGTATDNLGAPGHSWQITLCSGMSIGHKGMIYAAKAMADAAGKLLRDPDLVEKAKAEFLAATGGKPYQCPIPPEVKAPGQK